VLLVVVLLICYGGYARFLEQPLWLWCALNLTFALSSPSSNNPLNHPPEPEQNLDVKEKKRGLRSLLSLSLPLLLCTNPEGKAASHPFEKKKLRGSQASFFGIAPCYGRQNRVWTNISSYSQTRSSPPPPPSPPLNLPLSHGSPQTVPRRRLCIRRRPLPSHCCCWPRWSSCLATPPKIR